MRLACSLLAACLACLAGGCPQKGAPHKPPAALPSAKDVIARLAKLRAARTSFTAESVMDYWLGKDRVKGTVLVMGTAQRQVRFNALSPQGGSVLADMACNGTDFSYVDFQNNCQLTGPCTRSSIAQLLRVELEPEDFFSLALGVVPVHPEAQGTVEWDASKGHERVVLESPAGKQTIVIDARDGRSDVLSSQLVHPGGKVVWSVENTDFETVKDASSGEHRLPGKTRFKSPSQDADLLVEWKERAVNVTINPAKFTVNVPAGLPLCGSTGAGAGAAAPTSPTSPTSSGR
jgi:hypothetical protein